MLPSKRATINFVFSSLEFTCTRCQKRISLPEKMMTASMLFTGVAGLASAEPAYMFGGVLVAAAPFFRRMRNPVMSEETIALGLGIIPDALAEGEAPRKPKASEPKSRAFDAAENAIDRAIAARGVAAAPAARQPIAAAERFHGSRGPADTGFGRRRPSPRA